MTKWAPMPIRQPGQPWQGMDTAGGRLDNGSGQLTQNSRNVTINEVDRLQKRTGFVRGLAERFGTVVCGLHTYTDNCGQQWLLVASDEEIAIRQPFDVQVFENDDSYPQDDFETGGALDSSNWRNTSSYLAAGGSMTRTVGDSATPFDAASYVRWFKGASSKAYEVTVEYEFDVSVLAEQVLSISIKGIGDLTEGRRLQADLVFDPVNSLYRARIYKANPSGALTEIGQLDVSGSLTSPSGFFTLSYERTFNNALPVFLPSIEVTPNGGSLQSASGFQLNELEDMELGQISAIGCGQGVSILQVTGGPV